VLFVLEEKLVLLLKGIRFSKKDLMNLVHSTWRRFSI